MSDLDLWARDRAQYVIFQVWKRKAGFVIFSVLCHTGAANNTWLGDIMKSLYQLSMVWQPVFRNRFSHWNWTTTQHPGGQKNTISTLVGEKIQNNATIKVFFCGKSSAYLKRIILHPFDKLRAGTSIGDPWKEVLKFLLNPFRAMPGNTSQA